MKKIYIIFPLKFPCFLYDSVDVANLIIGSSTPSKPSLDIRKFLIYVLLKARIQDFKCDVTRKGDACNYLVV